MSTATAVGAASGEASTSGEPTAAGKTAATGEPAAPVAVGAGGTRPAGHRAGGDDHLVTGGQARDDLGGGVALDPDAHRRAYRLAVDDLVHEAVAGLRLDGRGGHGEDAVL